MGEKFYRIVKLLVKIVQILLSKLFAEIFVHQLSHMVNWWLQWKQGQKAVLQIVFCRVRPSLSDYPSACIQIVTYKGFEVFLWIYAPVREPGRADASVSLLGTDGVNLTPGVI